MEEKNYIEPPYLEEEADEIDVMELLRKLWGSRKMILRWCSIAVVVGLVIGFSIPREYTVSSKLAPETVSKTSTNSLSSLANLAGINLGVMNTADAVYPDLYPDIVSSTPFVVELFPVQVDFEFKKEKKTADYYTYLRDYTRCPWWGKVFAAPFKALGWVVGLFHKQEEKPVQGYASVNPSELTQEQDAVAKDIRENISLSVDKKTSVISLSVTAQDPHVAARISEEVIERLKTYVTNYRTEKSRADLAYYENLYEKAKDAYFTAQQRYARYVDSNQGIVLQRVRTEQERLQNEMNLTYQLYNTCSQQLQASKAKVQMETPVFTIINPPQVPLKRSAPSKVTILVACVFFAFVFASVWALWGRDLVAGLKKKEEEDR